MPTEMELILEHTQQGISHEVSELQPLAARTTPPSSDHTPTLSDPTPVSPLTNKEFEASEPSDTRITTSPSDSTTPLSLDDPLIHTTPTLMLPNLCTIIGPHPILDTKIEDDESEVEDASSGSEESDDAGPNSDRKEAAPEGQQQQTAQVKFTTADRPLGLGNEVARCRALEIVEEISPSTFEIG
nr:hypothetical protein [Tanacetum cinerariifolium]